MATRYIERQRTGQRTFKYFHDGRQVTGKSELEYFKSIGVPPAWKDVKIAASHNARIQATGIDKAGRLQYVYHPKFRARQEKEKFERILRFAKALPKMRKTTQKHIALPGLPREKVLACIVQLMDKAYFRVGNEIYAKENQSYGLTTLRSKHTRVWGDTIIFDFIGKSGQAHLKKVNDKKLAKIVKQLDELPGYEIFKYVGEDGEIRDIHSDDVNEYIKEVMGEEFSAKDFRTWGGTLLASMELSQTERSHHIKEREKAVTECVKKVAQKLGNTPAIARASYIDPRVIKAYVVTNDLYKVREAVKRLRRADYLTADEHCVLNLLQKSA
ncbi:DNA topoisomerase IB [Candidatus Saccharibacteria bacterium]|nr:DNA topoisomerase IB [Candidatus Saccharibacteria bacterium]